MHHPRLLLVHPDGLCQRLEPSQQIRHMPQQGRRRQAHPELGPLPLEGPRRVPLPIHLHQERHPHAQAIARAAEQRRLQRREHFRHRLPRPSRALACGPVAWPPDPPHVRLDLDLDPVADRRAVAAVGPPAVQTLALDRLRLVPLLPHRQAGPRRPAHARWLPAAPRATAAAPDWCPHCPAPAVPARRRCRPDASHSASRTASSAAPAGAAADPHSPAPTPAPARPTARSAAAPPPAAAPLPATAPNAPSPARACSASNAPLASPRPTPPPRQAPAPAASRSPGPTPTLPALPAARPTAYSLGWHKHT